MVLFLKVMMRYLAIFIKFIKEIVHFSEFDNFSSCRALKELPEEKFNELRDGIKNCIF